MYESIRNPSDKEMKMLSEQLKQALNALEFANAGHLHALTARLNQAERTIAPNRAEPEDESAAHEAGSTAFSN